ncbi:MAG: hypothetical protein M1835_004445 [Candelina submexicana]|nr:MAG: hypothetical protein M1835_004445 [Candelina submexicana]
MALRSTQASVSPVQKVSHTFSWASPTYCSIFKSPPNSHSTCSTEKGKDTAGSTQEPLGSVADVESSLRSRNATGSSSIDSVLDLGRHRTSVGRFDGPDTFLGDDILEPCPDLQISSSVLEVLSRASTTDSAGAREPSLRPTPSSPASGQWDGPTRNLPRDLRDLPRGAIRQLLQCLSYTEYLSLRLTCRSLSAHVTSIKPPELPAVYYLPVEILQQTYSLLRPVDFNAARHTCRAWMISSLKKSLLIVMLKRAGWWTGTEADLASYSQRRGCASQGVSDEWLLSKKLARECSLGPDWTGNGLRRSSPRASVAGPARADPTDESSELPEAQGKLVTGLSLTSTIDFSELGSASVPSPHGPGLILTVSTCGRYLMVADGCLVYIFSLQSNVTTTNPPSKYGGSFHAVTALMCPHRVLAVSMDTSSQRFAIAVLGDGRRGIVFDLHHDTSQRLGETGSSFSHMSGLIHADLSYQFPGSCKLAGITLQGSNATSNEAISEPATISPSDATNGARDSDRLTSNQYDHHACMLNNTFRGSIDETDPGVPLTLPSGTNVSTYRNLCSEKDPPRSIAICPQRRCVAFGCAAGIELHWVDALTNQDLNRWFPLTAPSDFLFFLPPRKGIDSSKKLRLISSAARPQERPAISKRFFGGLGRGGEGFWSNLLCSSGAASEAGLVGANASDHHRAIPLSDGYHVVFTDPGSGCVCIGSDAPVGGPTKLIRRIMFLGPNAEEGREGVVWPGCYAVGRELRWGVRVVVCFGDAVWLFCVPGDVWQDARSEIPNLKEEEEESGAGDWKAFWKGDQEDGEVGGVCLWPVRVRGQEIGRVVGGVVDLAVESGGAALRVWAFASGGRAWAWEVDDGRGRGVRRREVLRGARVVDLDCGEESGERGVSGFDGANSSEDVDAGDPTDLDNPFRDEGYSSGDGTGDVEMPDAPDWGGDEGDVGLGDGDGRHRLDESGSGDSVEWIVDLLRDQGEGNEDGAWEGDEGFFDGLGVGRLVCDVL